MSEKLVASKFAEEVITDVVEQLIEQSYNALFTQAPLLADKATDELYYC